MTAEPTTDPVAEGSVEDDRNNFVLQIVQGLMSAHNSTVNELVGLSTHRGLYELSERLRQMYVAGYDHIALVDLFTLIDEIHDGLDSPEQD